MTRVASNIGMLLVLGAVVAPVRAASPVHLVVVVEEVHGTIDGVQPFALLAAGTQIALPAGATLVLGYLRSCTEETIDGGKAGGKIVVGAEQSAVDGASVLRETVECDGGRVQLTPEQMKTSGVSVARGIEKMGPPTMLHSVSPIIVLGGPAPVTIERTDKPAVPIAFVAEGWPGKAIAVDLDQRHVALVPGATYRVRARDRARLFTVAPDAKPGALPPVSRLLRLD